jgi:hypothetical protein
MKNKNNNNPYNYTWIAGSILATYSAMFGSLYSIHWRIPFPFEDMVETMLFFDGNPAIFLGEGITKFHNMEHRPALPVFFWYADRELFASSGLLPLVSSHIFLAIATCVVVRCWAKIGWDNRGVVWFLIMTGLALSFSLVNWYNLMWEMQVHVSLSLFFISLAALFAGRLEACFKSGDKSDKWINIIGINISGWLGAFCFGYGLPILFVVSVHSILIRWRSRYIIIEVTTFIILISFYIYLLNLRDRKLNDILSLDPDFFSFLTYVPTFLGSIFGSINLSYILTITPKNISLLCGIIIVSLYIFGIFKIYIINITKKCSPTSSQTASIIVTSCCVVIAVMTWISRSDISSALSDRYRIVSCFFMLALPGLFIKEDFFHIRRLRGSISASFIGMGFLIFGLTGNIANYSQLLERRNSSVVAAIGADFGVYVPGPNEIIGPPIHQFKDFALRMWKQHRERLIQSANYIPFAWRERRLSEVMELVPENRCTGEIVQLTKVPNYGDAFVFVGWAQFHSRITDPSDWIVVTNSDLKVVGLGAIGRPSEEGRRMIVKNDLVRLLDVRNSGLAGYIRVEKESILRFFIVNGEGACIFYASGLPR